MSDERAHPGGLASARTPMTTYASAERGEHRGRSEGSYADPASSVTMTRSARETAGRERRRLAPRYREQHGRKPGSTRASGGCS